MQDTQRQEDDALRLDFEKICSMIVFDFRERMDGNRLGEVLKQVKGISIYFIDGREKVEVPQSLLYFIYSEELNYRAEFIQKNTAFWAALHGVSVRYASGRVDTADMVLHGYGIGIVVAYLLYDPSIPTGSPDDVIAAELGREDVMFEWEDCDAGSFSEFAKLFFSHIFGKGGLLSSPFSIYYVSSTIAGLEELKAKHGRAMYGMIDTDWSFRKVKDALARKIVENDVSMVDGVSLYFMKERGVVFFEGEPCSYIEGITGYDEVKLKEVLKDLCDKKGLSAHLSDERSREYAPFVDYAVELDSLRVQDALLEKYNQMLRVGHRYRKEMIAIKNSVSSGMDIYYAINSATIEGVRFAIESAKKEMHIDDALSLIYKKMELVADSLSTRYDIENNTWNSVFAMLVAVFGFGTLIAALVFHFLPGLQVLYSFSIIVGMTAIITAIVVMIARINIENRTRGT